MIVYIKHRMKKFREQFNREDLNNRIIGQTIMTLYMYCKQSKRKTIKNSIILVLPLLKQRAILYMLKKKALITSGKL